MTDTALQDFLDQQVEQQLIAGAVIGVVDANGQMEITCAGMADREKRRPMQADTQFWVASISKPIAATATMCAVEDGLIDLDATVSEYLPIFKQLRIMTDHSEDQIITQPCVGNMTVRQCLSHTAGFQFLSSLEYEHGIDVLSLSEAVVAYAMTPLQAQAGEQYAYSNMGVNIVCRILEKQTGIPYPQFVEQRLFEPLGMRQTSVWPSVENEAKIACCYQHDESGALRAIPIPQVKEPYSDTARQPHPGGCYFSDVADLMRFAWLMLLKGESNGQRIISESSVAEMTQSQTKLREHDYGLCWAVDERGFGHGGATGTHLQIIPRLQKACVYLVHHQGSGDKLAHILPWIHRHVFDDGITEVNEDGLMTRM